MLTVNAATGVQPFSGLRVRDLGDAWIEQPFTLEGALAEIEAFYRRVVTAGVRPLSVGGDHSVTLPILRAVGAAARSGWCISTPTATRATNTWDPASHHGTPFRRAVEEGVLDPARVIQIGLRGHSNVAGGLWTFSTESGMRVMPMDELQDRGWRWAVEEARRVVGDGPTYLSFDIDSLDPVYAPGTGTPEAGGLTMIDALRMLRGLTGLNIVGGDVVEVSPPFDVGGLTAFHGASILFEILSLMAARRVSSPRRET